MRWLWRSALVGLRRFSLDADGPVGLGQPHVHAPSNGYRQRA